MGGTTAQSAVPVRDGRVFVSVETGRDSKFQRMRFNDEVRGRAIVVDQPDMDASTRVRESAERDEIDELDDLDDLPRSDELNQLAKLDRPSDLERRQPLENISRLDELGETFQ